MTARPRPGPRHRHTYAADGTYTVGLTVTDGQGATDTATTSVTVAGDPSVARDAFGRSVTGGWGTADRGGAWTLSGTLSRYSVAAGAGSVSLGAGSSAKPMLNAVSITDTDFSTVFTTDKAPTGGGQYVSLVGRAVTGGSEYRAKLLLASTGAVTAYLTRVDAGTEVSLGSAVVPGLTYTAGTKLQVRFQAVGTSPTTLRVKVWPQGQTEPAAWVLSRTDSTAALQTRRERRFLPLRVRLDDQRPGARQRRRRVGRAAAAVTEARRDGPAPRPPVTTTPGPVSPTACRAGRRCPAEVSAAGALGRQLAHERDDAVAVAPHAEQLAGRLATGQGDLAAPGGVGEQRLDGVGHGVGVAGRHVQPGLAVDDALEVAAHPGGDDRALGQLRLDDDVAQGVAGRQGQRDVARSNTAADGATYPLKVTRSSRPWSRTSRRSRSS